MSRSAKITFEWGDGEHTFRLAMKHVEELQEATGYGPERIFKRLEEGDWGVKEIWHTLRIGLIGGGETPAKAKDLMERHCGEGTWMDNLDPAKKVIAAAVSGTPDEAPKKIMGEVEIAPPSPTVNGASLSSMETAP